MGEPSETGEMTVMTAAMVAKYCAMEEMNGRVNPALSDSDEDSNGKPGTNSVKKRKDNPDKSESEGENEKKPAGVKSVKQYQTKL